MSEDFIKNYNEENWKIYELHNDLPFLPERMKIEKVENLVANLHDKTEYVIHMKNLKQTLNHGLDFKNYIEWLNLIKMIGKNYILM